MQHAHAILFGTVKHAVVSAFKMFPALLLINGIQQPVAAFVLLKCVEEEKFGTKTFASASVDLKLVLQTSFGMLLTVNVSAKNVNFAIGHLFLTKRLAPANVQKVSSYHALKINFLIEISVNVHVLKKYFVKKVKSGMIIIANAKNALKFNAKKISPRTQKVATVNVRCNLRHQVFSVEELASGI